MYPVFTYATLRPGQKDFNIHLKEFSYKNIPSVVKGKLYVLKQSRQPAYLEEDGEVKGDLIYLNRVHYDFILSYLDAFAGFTPNDKEGSWRIRKLADVVTVYGTIEKAWIYVWNGGDRRYLGETIESGNWLDFVNIREGVCNG